MKSEIDRIRFDVEARDKTHLLNQEIDEDDFGVFHASVRLAPFALTAWLMVYAAMRWMGW